VALIYSIKVYLAATDAEAKKYSTKAKVFNIAASCIGFLLIAGIITYILLDGVITWRKSTVIWTEATKKIIGSAAIQSDTQLNRVSADWQVN